MTLISFAPLSICQLPPSTDTDDAEREQPPSHAIAIAMVQFAAVTTTEELLNGELVFHNIPVLAPPPPPPPPSGPIIRHVPPFTSMVDEETPR